MKEIVAECKPFKKSHICRMDDFLEDAQAKVLSPKRYLSWLQKKVDNTRGGHFRKPYLEKMVRFLDKMGKRDEAVAAMEANKDKDDELRLLYVDMLTEWKMYDQLVKFCMHTSYNAEENLEKYAKYMSEADQRLVAQDIIERMKRRAPECRRGDDYDHFAGWIRRLYNSSPECEKIAREVAEEIVKENPNKAFRRMFERILGPTENHREK